MADAFSDWYVHFADVDTLGAIADDGAATTTTTTGVACWVEDATSLVRGSDGAQVVSSSRLHVALGDAGLFSPGSTVRVNGRTSEVLSRATSDSTTGDSLDGAVITLS